MSAEVLPDLPDTVFHLTTVDKAAAILENGLQPNPERGRKESWHKLEQFMDDIRPQYVKDLGISRRSGVFAYPDLEVLKPRYLDERAYVMHKRRPSDETAFGIDVNPRKVMVFDMNDLEPVNNIATGNYETELHTDPQAIERGLRYWNDGVSLDDFRRYYRARHTDWSSTWELKDEFHNAPGLKSAFLEPEVIVPGPIVGESLRWAASAITLQDIEVPLSTQ